MTTIEKLDISTDEAGVRDLLAELAAAWAAQDADGFAALYTQDATVVTSAGYSRGKDEIRAFMTAGFAGRLKGTSTSEEPDRIRLVSDGVAIVNSVSAVVLPGEAAPRPEMLRRSTWVMTRVDNRWLVEAYHNCATQD